MWGDSMRIWIQLSLRATFADYLTMPIAEGRQINYQHLLLLMDFVDLVD